MMKHLQSLGKVALGTTTAITASLYTLNQLTPMPGVILSKILFNQPSKKAYIKDTVRQDARFKQIASRVTSLYDVVYDSTEKTGLMDIYMPNGDQETYPTLFWVHGGGYMSGDKSDVTPYLQLLASEGYTVVNLNYALVPEAHYPEPIYSLEKAYVAVQKTPKRIKRTCHMLLLAVTLREVKLSVSLSIFKLTMPIVIQLHLNKLSHLKRSKPPSFIPHF